MFQKSISNFFIGGDWEETSEDDDLNERIYSLSHSELEEFVKDRLNPDRHGKFEPDSSSEEN